MYQIDDTNAAASLPALPTDNVGTPGFFTGGNPATGTPPTRLRFWWFNMIQEELRTLVRALGLTPSKTDNTQVWRAATTVRTAPIVLTAASGSFTVPTPPGIAAGTLIRTKITFAGGGGGGSAGLSAQAGAGGGAGGFGWGYWDLAAGATYTYQVGAGGAGGLPGQQGDSSTTGIYGGRNGGVTWIKDPSGTTIFSVNGGSTGLTASGGSAGGTGSVPPTASGNIGNLFATGGGAGGDGSVGSDLRGGDGAAGPWGGQGRAGDNTPTTSALAAANAYGAGGGGSYGPNPGTAGAGAPGVIVIEFP